MISQSHQPAGRRECAHFSKLECDQSSEGGDKVDRFRPLFQNPRTLFWNIPRAIDECFAKKEHVPEKTNARDGSLLQHVVDSPTLYTRMTDRWNIARLNSVLTGDQRSSCFWS
ncbi:hypothetical protein NPIL_137491 [Nephila pilipes]|uniref:Uncharacterized protein n=1 Tax=Nephila pilipes TaxID=299642 RepID=A0A8X6PF24_NEPPI|nr:hypothetical protein NPIL_137491 [Nephila pilipes]